MLKEGLDERPAPMVLTIRGAAEELEIAVSTAYRLASEGRLPGVVRVGGRLRVLRSALHEQLARQVEEAAGRS